ncbi:glycosyltransferase [Coraliomargarita sp. SDUM461003]|uniref:Glycosyltransferase n=1 Tax=Thalassobacterium maritimum TaxID=3041265 RepID=A0ABU1AYE2_9BACT|nr:glycosyltransferase [Coraliomargarita sp. SDUM461003]MDQ8209155.1 glycosyltransferase [Coraliomargarita sp. SDUM461003]
MRIAVLSSSISRLAGGLFFSVRALSNGIATRGSEVSVFSLKDCHSEEDIKEWAGLNVSTSPVCGPRAIGFSPELATSVRQFAPDVLHVHGLWQYTSCVAHQEFRKRKAPYVMSPRGMLDPWAVGNSSFKKKVAAFLYESRNLKSAACMHALNLSEAQSIRDYGLKQPVCVLPNGVDLPSDELLLPREDVGGKKRIVFIGRIHPKKGIHEMLNAWARASKEFPSLIDGWELVVAGWDDGGHLEGLKEHATDLSIIDSVSFPGAVYGDEKVQLLRSADWFILPSHSEGMPMAVLEAWSYGIPAVLTPACNLPEGFSAGAAISVDPVVGSIFEGFLELLELPDSERLAMGASARALVEDQFTWSQIAREMQTVYEWMRGGSVVPSCMLD